MIPVLICLNCEYEWPESEIENFIEIYNHMKVHHPEQWNETIDREYKEYLRTLGAQNV